MTQHHKSTAHFYELDLLTGRIGFCNAYDDNREKWNPSQLTDHMAYFCQINEGSDGLNVGQTQFDLDQKAWIIAVEYTLTRRYMTLSIAIPDEYYDQVVTEQVLKTLMQ